MKRLRGRRRGAAGPSGGGRPRGRDALRSHRAPASIARHQRKDWIDDATSRDSAGLPGRHGRDHIRMRTPGRPRVHLGHAGAGRGPQRQGARSVRALHPPSPRQRPQRAGLQRAGRGLLAAGERAGGRQGLRGKPPAQSRPARGAVQPGGDPAPRGGCPPRLRAAGGVGDDRSDRPARPGVSRADLLRAGTLERRPGPVAGGARARPRFGPHPGGAGHGRAAAGRTAGGGAVADEIPRGR